MDNFLKNQLYRWTYEKIKSNPKKFGGDDSNSLIMQSYFSEVYNVDLPKTAYKILSTVSRNKNKLLEKNPQFDKRIKYKSNIKKNDSS